MPGGQRRQGHVRPDHRLAAEGPADIVRQDPDLGRGQPEHRGDGQLHGLDALAGVIQRQLVPVPDRGGGQRLDRVVVVRGEPEGRVDAQVRSREPVRDVPALHLRGHEAAEDLLRFVGAGAALADRGHGRGLGVADLHQRRGVLSLLEALGHDDRDRLAGVVNHVILHREERLAGRRAAHQGRDQRHLVHLRHVPVGQDPGYALGALGLLGVDRSDPAARHRGADDLGVGQARQRDLTRVPCGSGDFRRAVDPADLLPDSPAHRASPFVSVTSARTIARRASSTLNAFSGLGAAAASSS